MVSNSIKIQSTISQDLYFTNIDYGFLLLFKLVMVTGLQMCIQNSVARVFCMSSISCQGSTGEGIKAENITFQISIYSRVR